MKRSFMLLAACAFTLSAMSAGAATKCKDPTTHKFIKCPAAASSAPAASSSPAKKGFTLPHMPMTHSSGGSSAPAATASASTGHAPHCKTGKPCGNSCIAQNKVCHKS